MAEGAPDVAIVGLDAEEAVEVVDGLVALALIFGYHIVLLSCYRGIIVSWYVIIWHAVLCSAMHCRAMLHSAIIHYPVINFPAIL